MERTERAAVNSFLKKGYIPLACNRYAGIGWEGEYLNDFWMWNGQFMAGRDGKKRIQTVRVVDMKEAAIRYWRDGWVPLKEIDEKFLRRMEDALRRHRGLKLEGAGFPDAEFLEMRGPIPEEFLGHEVMEYLGRGKRADKGPSANATRKKAKGSD